MNNPNLSSRPTIARPVGKNCVSIPHRPVAQTVSTGIPNVSDALHAKHDPHYHHTTRRDKTVNESVNTWEKLPALDGRANPCACCSPIPAKLSLADGIAVGFGSAYVSQDGEEVLDGERIYQQTGEAPSVEDAEKMAIVDPDHDWRIVLHGPLHGETYQRQGVGEWVLVEKNQGFA